MRIKNEKELGQVFRSRRKKLGYTQADVAER